MEKGAGKPYANKRGEEHKRRVVRVKDILERESDKNNRMTVRQLLERLGLEDTEHNRRNVRLDLKVLEEEGTGVRSERHGSREYYLGERLFRPDELQILADVVQSSRSLDQETSDGLVSSVLSLMPEAAARAVRGRVALGSRVKTGNGGVFRNIAVAYGAMGHHPAHLLSFRYCDMMPDGTMKPRHNGRTFEETPVYITHINDCYYLITLAPAKGGRAAGPITRRLDRMEAVLDTGKPGADDEEVRSLGLAEIERRQFGMFLGDPQRVRLRARNARGIGAVVDHFGDSAIILEWDRGEGTALFAVDVFASRQFFSWLWALDDLLELVEPEELVERYEEELRKPLRHERRAAEGRRE